MTNINSTGDAPFITQTNTTDNTDWSLINSDMKAIGNDYCTSANIWPGVYGNLNPADDGKGYSKFTIEVCSNGFTITTEEPTSKKFIFSNIEEMNEWIKENIHPTDDAVEFTENL